MAGKESTTLQQIKKYPGQKVKLAVTDIDGVLRGKVVHMKKFESIAKSGLGFCNVVFGWDSSDACYDNVSYTGWHSGYPDAQVALDLNTYRTIPWDNDMPFVLGDFWESSGKPLAICPRNLLKTVVARAAKSGYKANFSQEFEWFNFIESSETLHNKGFRDPEPLSKGMFGYSLLRPVQSNGFFNDIFDLLNKYKVPLEGLHTETGPGVYEAAILYSDVVEAADRAVLFKAALKEIGSLHGITPTFMAKWNASLPGSSGHVHQSLWKNGKNCFFDPKASDHMSETMKHYLAGLLHCLPHITPMYAPNINSYKRLVEGAWAPTTLTWGIDNRTTAVRALPGSENSTRLELRVVGADANPYLAMAAALASGLYGIKNKLALKTKPTKGNGYNAQDAGVLPRDLLQASQAMSRSKIARELFGDEFVEHFTNTRIWEWREYSKAVTDWEMKRYFEIT